MMVDQNNIQTVFANAIMGRDEGARGRAIAELSGSENPDFQIFGQIAGIMDHVLYEKGDPASLDSISVKFFPVRQTRENFQILEKCFYALFTHSKDTQDPSRSRALLDQAINLLGLIGRNGFDVSQGTILVVEHGHIVASGAQKAKLVENLMICKGNVNSFLPTPPFPSGVTPSGKTTRKSLR